MPLFAYSGKVHAPEFAQGLSWFNTAKPLTLKGLRGRLVLLDFWTYCCINCMHVLPDLKYLEKKYAHQLTVIGVHSPKFPNEKVETNVRQAIVRYGIEHPVVHDPEMRYWREFAIRAWPTLVLIDPEGCAVAAAPGEGNREALDQVIEELITIFRMKGNLIEGPCEPHQETIPDSTLSFPGKIWADEERGDLWISDSNHHRILGCSMAGKVHTMIGNGEAGDQDGDHASAQFSNPQGLCRIHDYLYVADTDNHLIKRVDLKEQQVLAIAGNGVQAEGPIAPGYGTEATLNSPWDILYAEPNFYIAMAGSHQIVSLHPEKFLVQAFSGNGAEARIDGTHPNANFAQPSGLAKEGKCLYVADSEVSAIRKISLDPKGKVETLVGLDLFIFGDQDGTGREVRLQHPLGITWGEGLLWIADTYNHKIKSLNPKTLECKTIAGNGMQGQQVGPNTQCYEPGGITFGRGMLYIADTNNHRILRVDPKTGQSQTIDLSF